MKNQQSKNKKTGFKKETAGKIMIENFPKVLPTSKIKDVEKLLIKNRNKFETINYIYITDEENTLKGVISIKELFRADKNSEVIKYSSKKTYAVHASTDQEKIAYLALKHNLKSVPVINKEKKLLGIIPSDIILKVLDMEAKENLFRIGGISTSENKYGSSLTMPLIKSLKQRMPWLIIGLIGGIIASGIVNEFEEVLSKNLILASFIPLIVYISDAVGSQMQAFIIRDLAIKENVKILKYVFHQFKIVGAIGILLSGLLFLSLTLVFKTINISLIISLALFCAIISSLLSGLIIPYLFNKMKIDPANASGPIATILQDLASIFIYFSIGNYFLS